MQKPDKTPFAPSDGITSIPPQARILTALGDKTAQAVESLYKRGQLTLLPIEDVLDLSPLGEALTSKHWSDDEAAKLLYAYAELKAHGRLIEIKSLARWARFHVNDADTVIDCMKVQPPEEIELIRVLSRKGSQKLVFLATWSRNLQEVVVKQILVKGESAERILNRELQPHPLSMVHPNIIETHFLANRQTGERFLVERRLTEVLDDTWESQGIHEASNLLSDITKALKFLHDHHLVHGDVKPDNIGKRGVSYILLDFGICRDRDQFTCDTTATGSLRTRAPELLQTNTYPEPEKIDVWALGATIYNTVAKRFPLINTGEKIPRNTQKEKNQRDEFEEILKLRVKNEWNKWVDLTLIPSPLKEILAQMLDIDPKTRINSTELLMKVEKELASLLRSPFQAGDTSGRFSPLDELGQIRGYLNSIENQVEIIPRHKRQTLLARLHELESNQGFTTDDKGLLNRLQSDLAN